MVLNDSYLYDLNNKEWKRIETKKEFPSPSPRAGHSSTLISKTGKK